MADEADKADIQTEVMVSAGIANAKANMVGKKGPEDCVKCGDWNNRADSGYTTCSNCYEITLANLG